LGNVYFRVLVQQRFLSLKLKITYILCLLFLLKKCFFFMLICFEKAYFTITLYKTIFLNELIMHQPNESQFPNFTFLQILMHFQWHAPSLTTSLSLSPLSTFFSPKQVKFNRRNVMGNNQTIQLHLIRKKNR
jgi:hypothetical protein